MIFAGIIIWLPLVFSSSDSTGQPVNQGRNVAFSGFPVVMYDSDIGFGFGGKGIAKNLLRKNESVDLILFGSTKGELWGVSTFSIPDPEIRHRTAYPLGLDVKIEFDRILKSNFFGIGNDSPDNDEQFPIKFIKGEVVASRGFTEEIVGETGLFYNNCWVYDYDGNPLMVPGVPGIDENLTSYLAARVRWDTRDNTIHPHTGWNLGFKSDFAFTTLGGDYEFQRYRFEINRYLQLFTPAHVLALRLWAQHIDGVAPYYEQSIIGGGWTARGFKASRFIDNAMTLASAEYRVIIYKKLGGVLFGDAGRVYPSLQDITFEDWKANAGAGLRYYVSGFAVRFDVGYSEEGMRIFFNFGHVY